MLKLMGSAEKQDASGIILLLAELYIEPGFSKKKIYF